VQGAAGLEEVAVEGVGWEVEVMEAAG
jgi:hypothetical protein